MTWNSISLQPRSSTPADLTSKLLLSSPLRDSAILGFATFSFAIVLGFATPGFAIVSYVL